MGDKSGCKTARVRSSVVTEIKKRGCRSSDDQIRTFVDKMSVQHGNVPISEKDMNKHGLTVSTTIKFQHGVAIEVL